MEAMNCWAAAEGAPPTSALSAGRETSTSVSRSMSVVSVGDVVIVVSAPSFLGAAIAE